MSELSGKELLFEVLQQIQDYENKWSKTPNTLFIEENDLNKLKDELINPYTTYEKPLHLVQKLLNMKIFYKNVVSPIVFYEEKPERGTTLTVKQLHQFLTHYQNEHTDVPIYIERVEDVYFEKHGWKTEHFYFENELEATEGIKATGVAYENNKIIILAHL